MSKPECQALNRFGYDRAFATVLRWAVGSGWPPEDPREDQPGPPGLGGA